MRGVEGTGVLDGDDDEMGDCATTLQEAGETDPDKSPRLVFSAPGVVQKSRSLSRAMKMIIGGGAYTVKSWTLLLLKAALFRRKGDARLGWQ